MNDLVLISLERAFRAAVATLEDQHGVPEGQRLGRLLFPRRIRDVKPRLNATGRRLREVNKPGQQPKRRNAEVELPELWGPVPYAPDEEQLEALISDANNPESGSSPAEQRAVAAHLWLMKELKEGHLRLFGDKCLIPAGEDDQEAIPLCDSRKVPEDIMASYAITYRNYRFENAAGAFVRSRELQTRDVLGSQETGELFFLNLQVPVEDLKTCLEIWRCGTSLQTLRMERIDDGERCTFVWFGNAYVILANNNNVQLLRGLRSLAILLRFPGRRISAQLVEATARRNVDTREQLGAGRAQRGGKVKDYWDGIVPIAAVIPVTEAELDEKHLQIWELIKNDYSQSRIRISWLPPIKDSIDPELLPV